MGMTHLLLTLAIVLAPVSVFGIVGNTTISNYYEARNLLRDVVFRGYKQTLYCDAEFSANRRITFAALMSQPEYQLEAYLALHPDARGRVTVDDIKDASIKNVFYNASYNDLSFVAEGRRIVMIEA